ncbi:MAG: galactokinase [candidate division KSB1 bacterium]|nr:galactokinase [candidate division KSB1 bacterium]
MSPEEMRVVEAFRREFGTAPEVVASAPGRVNLIGEHTDYNEGFVFPMAVDRRIWVAGKRSSSDTIRLVSLNGLGSCEVPVARLERSGSWADYPVGVVWALQRRGISAEGFDAVFFGTVPIGSGLSSSAALEVATLYLLLGLWELELQPKDRPLVCHEAETGFVGVRCGIMDQFISALAAQDHALFLDCRTIEYEQVPLQLGSHCIVITDSKKKRGLVDSEYNRRRQECEEGVRLLQEAGEKVKALRDVTQEMLEAHAHRLPETVLRRCRHVVTENYRVLKSVEALARSDLEEFGALMNESHDSLRQDYQVSCEELDLLVETARAAPGVLGSRLTGAGFGGCTVTLARQDAVDELIGRSTEAYRRRFGYEPEFMVSTACRGAEFLRL